MTAAIVWLVLWAVFTLFSWFAGLAILLQGSFFAGFFGKARLIAVTVPVGLVLIAFAVFSAIQVILQVISVITIAQGS